MLCGNNLIGNLKIIITKDQIWANCREYSLIGRVSNNSKAKWLFDNCYFVFFCWYPWYPLRWLIKWKRVFMRYLPPFLLSICDFNLKLCWSLIKYREKRFLYDIVEGFYVVSICSSVFQLNFQAIFLLLNIFNYVIIYNNRDRITGLSENSIKKFKTILIFNIQVLFAIEKYFSSWIGLTCH